MCVLKAERYELEYKVKLEQSRLSLQILDFVFRILFSTFEKCRKLLKTHQGELKEERKSYVRGLNFVILYITLLWLGTC